VNSLLLQVMFRDQQPIPILVGPFQALRIHLRRLKIDGRLFNMVKIFPQSIFKGVQH